jgi:SAM-dependent methyltransferase
MHCLGKRLILPELLDILPPEQARASLRDLVRINRRWGGHSTLRALLRETVPTGQCFSVLDVGAASGDMGARIREWYPAAKVTLLDYAESHLKASHSGASTGQRVVGDAFRLPFRHCSFDYVFCSLFLHHFRDEHVIELLKAFGEIARKEVLVIDLERHPIPYYFMTWSQPLLGWDPVTVHDGAISVEAAFRPKELEDLARRAGLGNPRVRRFRPAFRITLAAESTAKSV